ncbi:disulfide bond formation protein B [Labrys wisconsinensis]|uniref:Disulfide bond formation protein DsbB n=1 Tax=Labrys wisconsinensis TaxID=425677 RepID=A0ABU0J1U2_9HYPH|nr:disulfide bond formation protein B [Labrys wisconsinensis]MDQ0468217.1 disulfide bond formation protein DsbB [Labrys wisconsinensis]
MSTTLSSPGRIAAAVAAVVAFLVIAAALVLEHGFGYAPCPLCLEQRWPYYLGVPLAALLAVFGGRLPKAVLALGLLVLAGLFAWGLSIGAYQAGAEWGWWMGPRDCSAGNVGANPAGVGGLLDAINQSTVVSCTDPRLRILGLSLAGWNAVVMAGLIVVALRGAWRSLRSR